jgi:uncharacterized membrane protein
MALLSGDGVMFLLRWIHFLAGITWIGILYYFNFVQTPFFGSKYVADTPAVRTGIIVGGLLNTALWWFRWGAMFTFLSGWLIILHKMGQFGVGGFFNTSYGWAIFFGGMLGTVMWANVWFVIWPNQQVVMQSAAQVAGGGQAIPDAAARGAKAGVASRTNTMLSIPMLFFMGAASHLTMFASADLGPKGAKIMALVLLAIVIVVVEINALVGAATPDKASAGKKMLTVGPKSLANTFWAGLVLTVILYLGLEILFP